MRTLYRAVACTAVAAATTVAGGVAHASAPHGPPNPHAQVVFVQNDNPTGNVVFAYDRAPDGTLTLAGSYPTGGLGGTLDGSVVDHLASQGGLTLDPTHDLLFAVNAGSNTLSVFAVRGDQLRLAQILPTRGDFPVSVTVSGRLAYVLDARDGGAVTGYSIDHQGVQPIPGSTQPLGLDPEATPEFTHTPGQVTFSPDGQQLLVTTKANGNDVDVFAVHRDGRLSAPTVNALAGAVPFAATFDRFGHLVLAEAGTNSVATFRVDRAGNLLALNTLATGQTATCWITSAAGRFYVSNAGSATLSELAVAPFGTVSSIGLANTDPGTVDAAASSSGRFLYVQAGLDGLVDEYQISPSGTLTAIGSVTVPDAAGAEGIAAS